MGTPSRIEHSIQNAYLKGISMYSYFLNLNYDDPAAIQLSEHFVYIENQFFITSYVVSLWRFVIGINIVLAAPRSMTSGSRTGSGTP